LSRACLGKIFVFIYKWLKNVVFRREEDPFDREQVAYRVRRKKLARVFECFPFDVWAPRLSWQINGFQYKKGRVGCLFQGVLLVFFNSMAQNICGGVCLVVILRRIFARRRASWGRCRPRRAGSSKCGASRYLGTHESEPVLAQDFRCVVICNTKTRNFAKTGLFDVVGFQLADREVKAERKTVNAWAKKNKKELEGGEKKIQADYAEMLATVNAKV
jgi:hypothetical protein